MYLHVQCYDLAQEKLNRSLIQKLIEISHSTTSLILMYGEIGVGKTTLIKSFIQNISLKNIGVTSPSFLNYHIYQINDLSIVHYDFYKSILLNRIPEKISTQSLLPDEINSERCMVFIEWALPLRSFLQINYFDQIYVISMVFSPLQNNRILYLCKYK